MVSNCMLPPFPVPFGMLFTHFLGLFDVSLYIVDFTAPLTRKPYFCTSGVAILGCFFSVCSGIHVFDQISYVFTTRVLFWEALELPFGSIFRIFVRHRPPSRSRKASEEAAVVSSGVIWRLFAWLAGGIRIKMRHGLASQTHMDRAIQLWTLSVFYIYSLEMATLSSRTNFLVSGSIMSH